MLVLIGHILLGIVGLSVLGLVGYSAHRSAYILGMQHAVLTVTGVACILLTFLSAGITIGSSGVSVQVEKQRQMLDTLETILETSGSPQQKQILQALTAPQGSKDGWVDISPSLASAVPQSPTSSAAGASPAAAPPPEAAKSASKKTASKPASKPEAKPAAACPPPAGDTKDTIAELQRRGLVRVRDNNGQMQVKPGDGVGDGTGVPKANRQAAD